MLLEIAGFHYLSYEMTKVKNEPLKDKMTTTLLPVRQVPRHSSHAGRSISKEQHVCLENVCTHPWSTKPKILRLITMFSYDKVVSLYIGEQIFTGPGPVHFLFVLRYIFSLYQAGPGRGSCHRHVVAFLHKPPRDETCL